MTDHVAVRAHAGAKRLPVVSLPVLAPQGGQAGNQVIGLKAKSIQAVQRGEAIGGFGNRLRFGRGFRFEVGGRLLLHLRGLRSGLPGIRRRVKARCRRLVPGLGIRVRRDRAGVRRHAGERVPGAGVRHGKLVPDIHHPGHVAEDHPVEVGVHRGFQLAAEYT